ncbi:hypothetical protein ACFY0F_29960 [Streptomyces sp. NPDC001544]|uniref:hypothetical protein n=1 Tax=Streptomyces sp. NPDC001544 TaxID=3364584 RepID=UPI00367E238F
MATHPTGADGADELTVFAVNRNQGENVELALDLRAFPGYAPVGHPRATDTQAEPDRVRPYAVDTGSVTDDRLTPALPPVSWNVIRLRHAG